MNKNRLIQWVLFALVTPWMAFATTVTAGGDQVWVNKTSPYALTPGVKCPQSSSGWGCDGPGATYPTVTRTFERSVPDQAEFLPGAFGTDCEIQFQFVFKAEDGTEIVENGLVGCSNLQSLRFNPENSYVSYAPEVNLSASNIYLGSITKYSILTSKDAVPSENLESRYLLKVPPAAVYQDKNGELSWAFEYMFHTSSRSEPIDLSPNRPATVDLRLGGVRFNMEKEDYLSLDLQADQGPLAKLAQGPLGVTVALVDQIKLLTDCPTAKYRNAKSKSMCQVQASYKIDWEKSSAALTGTFQPFELNGSGVYKAAKENTYFDGQPIDVKLMAPNFTKTEILKFH